MADAQSEWTRTVVRGPKLARPLSYDQALAVGHAIVAGQIDIRIVAALCAAWRVRGETADEIAGIATAIRTELLRSGCVESSTAANSEELWLNFPIDGRKEDVDGLPLAAPLPDYVRVIGAAPATYPVFGLHESLTINLREVVPTLIQAVESMQILGLRTILHTVAKSLVPLNGLAIKGVTHTAYFENSIEAMRLMGARKAMIWQARGGQPLLQSGRRHRGMWLDNGVVASFTLFENKKLTVAEAESANHWLWDNMPSQPMSSIIEHLNKQYS